MPGRLGSLQSSAGHIERCRIPMAERMGPPPAEIRRTAHGREARQAAKTAQEEGTAHRDHQREGDGYVALCPDVDVASQGASIEQAVSLRSASEEAT